MATKQEKDRNALIKCEHCGEYYSVTYKECPFCDEYEDGDWNEGSAPRHVAGGKRLVTNTRGGGYGRGWTPFRIVTTVLSVAVIIAAACIVFSLIKPLIDRGNDVDHDVPPSAQVTPTPPAEATPTPGGAVPPTSTPEITPEPTPSQIPSTQTATGFTLNKKEFSFSDRYPEPITLKAVFSPAGTTGSITWTSADPDIASVDENGTVRHGSKKGNTTITATMAGGVTQTCKVYNSATGGAAAPSPSATPSVSGKDFSLSRSDFTLSKKGESYQIRVSGITTAVKWSSSNASVATVADDGTVTAVGKGTCTVTASIDGQSRECIVRVNF